MEVTNLNAKIAKISFVVLTALMMFVSIGVVGATKPQPHAMVWITKSDASSSAYTLTYQNFGYRSIGGISVAVTNSVTASSTLATFTATYAGWTVQSSSTQISWQSNNAPDRAHLDFNVYNAPCTLQWTLFDKNSNVLQTGVVNIA